MAKRKRYGERWMKSTTTDDVADDKFVVVAILGLKDAKEWWKTC